MKIKTSVLSEPYRIFFPLGWGMGIVGTSYWLLVSAGLIHSYAPLYHGIIQIELFSAAFAVGFLLTALPKFLRARTATNSELACLLVAYLWLAGSALANELFCSQWGFVFLIALLVRFAVVRIKERKAMPPFSFFLVGFGLLEGIIGALLILYPSSMFPLLGQKLVLQGMFLSLSLGIGSFLVPRIMGVVDTTNAIVSLPGRGKELLPWYKSPGTVVCVIGALIFSSFFIETGWNREAGLLLRAGLTFACLARFDVIKLPRGQSIAGSLAAISLWTMALGIFAAALLPSHEVGALHLMYIGGFGLLILTIGAQVISSHGGVPHFWGTYKTYAICIALLMILSALLRMSASFLPELYFVLLGSAALLFDIAILSWGFGVLRYILR